MKIAMVSEHASPLTMLDGVREDGRTIHVAALAGALTAAGDEVTVYTRRTDPQVPESVMASAGYSVVHVSAGPPEPVLEQEVLVYLGEFAERLEDRWQGDRPDVAHAHYWTSGVATQLAARRAAVPVLQTFHSLGVVDRRYRGDDDGLVARIRLERLIARSAARVIATCSEEVSELAEMGLPRSHTTVVPCGVDIDLFTPTHQDDPDGRPWQLLSVGKMLPLSGFDIAIAALTRLPNAELTIAGGPPEGDPTSDPELHRLREVAASLGVDTRVRFLGQVPHGHMPAVYARADVVVCTSWYESCGMVPLEAMGCGRPVIATAVGGMLDTVVHGVTGCLIPPKDPNALAGAVRAMFADRGHRTAWGIAGHDRAVSRYTWDRIASGTRLVYEDVLGAGMPSALR
ncbi:glycosyltransferase [Aldersonia kunmingensis]|uniref:glycosyltransferase n=1 Tax=Aldersonia kunmingensis TaxID=408066 RepID=UPI00082BA0F3|nr:glycosyltransferase [Aldersonia kunmingensis]